jgi:RHS repeat-associated protein
MTQCDYNSHNERLVGDPVDVVTGANIEIRREFILPGKIPFVWRRHYSSSKNDRMFALGWGHTHEYDHWLEFDIDGLRYTGPVGFVVKFPPVLSDGAECAAGGFVLRRINLMRYHIIDPGGQVMEFEFQDVDTPAPLKALRQGNASIVFGYGRSGYLESVLDSQGRLIRVENDPKGLILSLTLFDEQRPKGRVLISYRYDGDGNLVQGSDVYGATFSFRYDQDHRLISRTSRSGYLFYFEYDADGRCVRSRAEDGLLDIRLRYLVNERVTIVTRADDGQWQYFYDESGSITKIIDPYGGVRTFIFDVNGRVIEEIDPTGDVTQWVYGPAGNFIGKRSSLGHFFPDPDEPLRPDQSVHRIPARPVEWEYGDLTSLSKAASPEGSHDILYGFSDSVRRLIKRPQASPAVFPDADSIAVERNGRNKGKIYDLTGRLIEDAGDVGENGQPRRWVYDNNGAPKQLQDHDGSIYRFEHVSWNLRSREIDPLGHAVSFEHTRTMQVESVTDAGGTKSEFVYDLKDRLAKVRRHGVVKEEYQYDEANNLIVKLDGRGSPLLSFEIGPSNLKMARRLASGENHYFSYDERGYYKSVATDDFKVEFDYDGRGHRIQDKRDGLGVEHRFSGFRQLAGTTVLNRFEIQYRHVNHGVVVTDPTGKEHTLSFTADGVIVRRMSNGSAELSQYNSAGRCLFKSHMRRHGVEGYWTCVYSYSGEGDLLEAQDNVNGPTRYEYDAAHRLKVMRRDGKTEDFQYDAANNLLKQPGLDGVSLYEGNRLRAANGDEFEYNDRNHIAVRRGGGATTRYHYDSLDMLARQETQAGEWRANYDPLGRRTSKIFGQRRTDFYWDTDRLAAEVREDGRVRIYVYADAFAMTPILFVEYENIEADPASGKRYFIFSDHLASPVLVEDDDGKAVWQARLDPYGAAHIQSKAALDMPLRFPGHYYDSETGLHYNRFRYYSPELGRYLQSDPLGVVGSLNLYAYTSNPLKQVDVRGDNDAKKPKQPGDSEGKTPEHAGETERSDDRPPRKRHTLAELEEIDRQRKARGEEPDMEPLSPGHELQRWKDYQAKPVEEGKRKLGFEAWQGKYEQAINNSRSGLGRESDYRARLGGESRKVKTQSGKERQIDSYLEDQGVMFQFKEGKENLTTARHGGQLPNDEAIRRDREFVEDGQRVIWVLEKGGSKPLMEALAEPVGDPPRRIEVIEGTDFYDELSERSKDGPIDQRTLDELVENHRLTDEQMERYRPKPEGGQ